MPDWDSLSNEKQQSYLDRSKYLIDQGYVLDRNVEQFARLIYEMEIDFHGNISKVQH